MNRDIPEFLRHLPTYRGYPVPYFVPKDKDGVFQFKYASSDKIASCIKYHKCGICFKPLVKGNYAFICGPIGLQNRIDGHAPMHEKCAEYSMRICPHIFYEATQRTTDDNAAPAHQIREKPKVLFLVKFKKFQAFLHGKDPLVRFDQIVSETKYIYENGTLIQAP